MHKIIIAVTVTAILCLAIGFGSGFLAGFYATEYGREMVDEAMSIATAVEQPADVQNKERVFQERFSLNHPGNWWIDEDEENYDPEYYFTIYTPGYSYVEFDMAYSEWDEDERVQEFVDYFSEAYEIKSEAAFENWGNYEGVGSHIVWTELGEKYEARVFCYGSENISFIVTELWTTNDYDHVKVGYKQVEESFELFEAPADYIE